ncbi:hypothetical protein PRZ48_003262 [Zasmidium cellare]|uniref:DUF7820 domain-containing protein n=1 Tax=Zasmidium cellare TaxID=395010 RepID=A0ABR0EUJ3_ZASCE|nr:hypothetical protein PRZ48_003262 [Zasmidium cellare]
MADQQPPLDAAAAAGPSPEPARNDQTGTGGEMTLEQELVYMAEEWESDEEELDYIVDHTRQLFNKRGYEDCVELVCTDLLAKRGVPTIYTVQLHFFLAGQAALADDVEEYKMRYFEVAFGMVELEDTIAAEKASREDAQVLTGEELWRHEIVAALRKQVEKMAQIIEDLRQQDIADPPPTSSSKELVIADEYAKLDKYKQSIRETREKQRREVEVERDEDTTDNNKTATGDVDETSSAVPPEQSKRNQSETLVSSLNGSRTLYVIPRKNPYKLQPEQPHTWRDLSSSAPEVLVDPKDKEYVAATGKEVVASTEKQIASDDGKQVAPGLAPEVHSEESLPEAKYAEDEKEAIMPDYSSLVPEKPTSPGAQWRRNHKVVLLLSAGTMILLVIAVALGAGLGVALSRSSSGNSPPITSTSSAGPTFIPTGTGALALSAAKESSATCLTQRSQQVAWDCNLTPDSRLALALQRSPTSSGSLSAKVLYDSDYTGIQYGAQAPSMNTSLGQIMTVVDLDDESYGTAFHFQQTYDKVVAVPENAITTSTSKSRRLKRRDADQPNEQLHKRGQVASPGSRLWFCVFNETLIEAFIYLDKPSQPTTSTSSVPLSTTNLIATETAIVTSSDPSRTITVTPNPTTTTPNPWSTLPSFSRVVKLEERRIANSSTQAYCQKYQILEDGSANWIADSNGQPIIVQLEEDDSDTSGEGCRCEWMSGDES